MSSLNRQVLRLAIPNLLASISVPLIGIADTAMIGHLPEVAYLGAVATASTIFDVMFWGAGFLRMGTTSLVAQYFGAGDRRSCIHTLYRALFIALILALVLFLLRDLIAWAGFRLAGGSPEIQEWGKRYFEVRIYAVPLVMALLALNGFFLGTANAMVPMYITLVANLVNIGADYALIFGRWGAPEMGVVGAAWAAVLANVAALAVGGFFLCRKYGSYFRESLDNLFERGQLALVFRTNFHLLGRTSCLLAAQFAMLAMVSRMGEVALGANAIVWQIWALVSYGVDGFAFAAETLVGNRLGRRDFAGARAMARRILLWGSIIGVLFGVFYSFALEVVARAFTSHLEVAQVILSLKFLIACIQPLNGVVFIFDGIFIGANDMKYLFKAMALALLGVFIPAALILVYWLDWGIQGAWLAYNCLMLGRFLTLLPRYRGDRWLRTFIARE